MRWNQRNAGNAHTNSLVLLGGQARREREKKKRRERKRDPSDIPTASSGFVVWIFFSPHPHPALVTQTFYCFFPVSFFIQGIEALQQYLCGNSMLTRSPFSQRYVGRRQQLSWSGWEQMRSQTVWKTMVIFLCSKRYRVYQYVCWIGTIVSFLVGHSFST